MIKTKLATQDKSKKCSISKCPFPSVITIPLGLEQRRLCQEHYNQHKNQRIQYPVSFTKASENLVK